MTATATRQIFVIGSTPDPSAIAVNIIVSYVLWLPTPATMVSPTTKTSRIAALAPLFVMSAGDTAAFAAGQITEIVGQLTVARGTSPTAIGALLQAQWVGWQSSLAANAPTSNLPGYALQSDGVTWLQQPN
jgi:hypothetical protein